MGNIIDNNTISGYSKSCLSNYSVPVQYQNQNHDIITDASLGPALRQCSTTSLGVLANRAKNNLLQNNSTNTQSPIIQSSNQDVSHTNPPNQQTISNPAIALQNPAAALGLTNPNIREGFLGFNRSENHDAICIDYAAIFWIIIIIILIIFLRHNKYIS